MISSSVPENTSKETLMDIIYSCDGNMDAIEQKIVGLWDGNNEDAWTPVISRSEKVPVILLLHWCRFRTRLMLRNGNEVSAADRTQTVA